MAEDRLGRTLRSPPDQPNEDDKPKHGIGKRPAQNPPGKPAKKRVRRRSRRPASLNAHPDDKYDRRKREEGVENGLQKGDIIETDLRSPFVRFSDPCFDTKALGMQKADDKMVGVTCKAVKCSRETALYVYDERPYTSPAKAAFIRTHLFARLQKINSAENKKERYLQRSLAQQADELVTYHTRDNGTQHYADLKPDESEKWHEWAVWIRTATRYGLIHRKEDGCECCKVELQKRWLYPWLMMI
ncbi:hypothetical protein BU16DRAFT_543587 [Lophium mytilinum]|uniref:Uncharacterized protein n=1 Tax=Lophium mytilinum TaxID=390894 RepID=A0A6A6QDQ5_9PEZI|nr:hypothetical protein BU16DRAFT_543587 [Lophium mytilinum]